MSEIVATVLTERLGTYISADDLWPEHSRARRSSKAQTELGGDGSLEGAVRALEQLVGGARPLTIGGADLVAAVLDGLRSPANGIPFQSGKDRVLGPQAELIATHVAALRHLDDRQGGGALSLRYITNELTSVLDLLRSASYAPAVGRDLLISVADLAQLAGWMQFDAGETAIAQRYLLLGVRLAQAASDTGRALNDVGMLAYVVSYAGEGATAIQVIQAATSVGTSNQLLHARLAGRAATAHASNGDLAAFRRSAEQSQDLLASAPSTHDAPYLYYLNPDQLSAEAGHSLLTIAARSDLFRRNLLNEAAELLTPLATIGDDPAYQRSALLHGCQLAHVHLLRRDLEGTVEAARGAVSRIPEVQSGRCIASLRELRSSLAQRRRATVVADFMPELDAALERV